MANPFKNMPNNMGYNPMPNFNIQGIAQIRNMMSMLNGANNPQQVLNIVAQNNPQFKQVIDMCNGKNPQEIFYALCKERGVNPDDILNQLK